MIWSNQRPIVEAGEGHLVRRVGPEAERSLEDAEPNRLTQQVRRRRDDGTDVCLVVTIEDPGIHVVLRTPDCPTGLGGGPALNRREQEILAPWEKLHLNRSDFTGRQSRSVREEGSRAVAFADLFEEIEPV